MSDLERNINVRLASIGRTIQSIADSAGISRVTISQRKAKALSGGLDDVAWLSNLLLIPVVVMESASTGAVASWPCPDDEWWPVAGLLARRGTLHHPDTIITWQEDRESLIIEAASCH